MADGRNVVMLRICATNENRSSGPGGNLLYGYLGFEPIASWSRRLAGSRPGLQ